VDPEGNIASLHVGLIERDTLEEELSAVQARFANPEPPAAAQPAPDGEAG
jgi:hypothetical protein